VWLGYRDSGMTGWEANSHPDAFARVDVDAAARRVADVLVEERADAFTIYDWHGGYGHPDHIQVHRVGSRAAELVGDRLPALRVFEATANRDDVRRGFAEMRAAGIVPDADEDEWDVDGPMDDGNPMGTPEAELTLVVDVSDWVGRKREAIAAHRSQVTDSGFFLAIPEDMFHRAFGREWYVEHGVEPPVREGWLLGSE
jgi:LmbE family N-acetylglucosaminyl deacetylase